MYTVLYDIELKYFVVSDRFFDADADVFFFSRKAAQQYADACNNAAFDFVEGNP